LVWPIEIFFIFLIAHNLLCDFSHWLHIGSIKNNIETHLRKFAFLWTTVLCER